MSRKIRTSYKTIDLPKLNNLSPTIEGTTLKLMEEIGEFSTVVGKMRNLSGENSVFISEKEIANRMIEELLDIAQVATSMLFVLEEEHGIDIESKIKQHIDKLIRKGYIK